MDGGAQPRSSTAQKRRSRTASFTYDGEDEFSYVDFRMCVDMFFSGRSSSLGSTSSGSHYETSQHKWADVYCMLVGFIPTRAG